MYNVMHKNSLLDPLGCKCPMREDVGEFDEQILSDLISQGYSVQELLARFKDTRRKIITIYIIAQIC
jgi:hypothetical protein